MLSPSAFVASKLNLTGKEKGEVSVNCPFHQDATASASLNFKKGLLNCHGECHRGWNLLQVAKKLGWKQQEKKRILKPKLKSSKLSEEGMLELASQFLADRGQTSFEDVPVTITVDSNRDSTTFGYIYFRVDGMPKKSYVARNVLNNGNPKYLNSKSSKNLVLFSDKDSYDHFWLVEGIFDALALYRAGIKNVGMVLGSFNKKSLFPLRDKTLFILFDNDFDGWDGARKSAEQFREFGGNPVILELPRGNWKDVDEFWRTDRKQFKKFLKDTVSEFASNDVPYVKSAFTGDSKPLQILETGFPTLDNLLGGGFKDGAHVISGPQGLGKTSFVCMLAASAALEQGKRVLIASYELPKFQYWARFASLESDLSWSQIEVSPTSVEPAVSKYLAKLAKNIRVVNRWPIGKIRYVLDKYDVVIIDYLQRMPSQDLAEENLNVARNIRSIGDLAVNGNKIILVISSLSNQGNLKWSGDIGYVVQSWLDLKPSGLGDGKLISAVLKKNTRGGMGEFFLQPDFAHQIYTEVDPLEDVD
jgi:archaellum biogenesis ATPase FlaH